jgi:hypothetical protein
MTMKTPSADAVYEICIQACLTCATACQHCATECLKEDDIKSLSLCIALTRECAIVCAANAELMAIGGENARILCNDCATICIACAEECDRNGALQHCRDCAMVCMKCAEECKNLMEVSI